MTKTQIVINALLADHKIANTKVARDNGVSAGLVRMQRLKLEAAGRIPRWRSQDPSHKGNIIVDALIEDHKRSNNAIAEQCACSPGTIGIYRKTLEERGQIQVWRLPNGVGKRSRIRDELLKDHERSNTAIAFTVGCTSRQVFDMRGRMEATRKISRWRGRSEAPEDLIRAELIANHQRSNNVLAIVLSTNPGTIGRIRRVMEKDGEIPRWRGTNARFRQQAKDELLNCHERSNIEIGVKIGCSETVIGSVRKELERDGAIPVFRCTPAGQMRQMTYVVIGRSTGKCKVGKTSNLKKRMCGLRLSSPDLLDVVLTMDAPELEAILHKRLNSFWSHGEWFNYTDEARNIIDEIAKEAEASGVEIVRYE